MILDLGIQIKYGQEEFITSHKIILIGDSFAYGACVDKYAIAGNLRKSFENKNILNSYGRKLTSHRYLASLNKFAKEIISYNQNNDYIVMIVFNNDNIKNIEGYSEKILGSESLIEINESRSRPLKLSKNYIEVINKVSQEIIPESDNFSDELLQKQI